MDTLSSNSPIQNPKPSEVNTFVVVPALNESKYLKTLIPEILEITPNLILVDDGSIDATQKICESSNLHYLKHPLNLGKGAALKTGCDYAFNYLNAVAVILMDGDCQHRPQDLEKFQSLLNQGEDLILGIRSLDQSMPRIRQWANQSSSWFVMSRFGVYIPDIPSGYKAFTRQIYNVLYWQTSDYSVELEIALKIAYHKLPYTTVNIPTIYHDLNRGMNFLDALKTLSRILFWRP